MSKKRFKIKTKKRREFKQSSLATYDMSKDQVAKLFQADLIKYATVYEQIVRNLLLEINKHKSTRILFIFQKTWTDTPTREFYVSDFFFPSLSLTLEIDGKTHNLKQYKIKDQRKEDYLSSLGIRTVRITNKQVKTLDSTSLLSLLLKF